KAANRTRVGYFIVLVPREWACGLNGAAKQRLADAAWIDVVEIVMQLRDHSDVAAAFPVDWDNRLDPELEIFPDPEHTGVDRTRRKCPGGEGIGHRGLETGFNQRDQMIEEIGQAKINDGRFQIGHAVLDRSTPVEDARMKLGVEDRISAVGIDAHQWREIPGRNCVTELAPDRDRPDPCQRVRQVPEPLSEVDSRRVHVEGFGANGCASCAAPLHTQAGREHELMFGALEDPILQSGLQILKTVGTGGRRVDRTEKRVGRAERHSKVLGDPLGKFPGDIALSDRRKVAGLEAVDGWKGQLVIDPWVVDFEGGREETISHDLVGEAYVQWKKRN